MASLWQISSGQVANICFQHLAKIYFTPVAFFHGFFLGFFPWLGHDVEEAQTVETDRLN